MGCGVVFVAAGAESLPWGPGLWGCDHLSMSGGFPLLLCHFYYLCKEVRKLLGFSAVELGCELVLKSVICLVEVVGELALCHESYCGEIFTHIFDCGSGCEFGS